jgi:hypothetical protein
MMGRRDIQQRENANIAYFTKHGAERIIFNKLGIETGNTLEHEMTKLAICKELKSLGHKFATEVKLETRRADVFDFTTGEAIEVQCSEQDTSIEAKRTFWTSKGWDFIVIKVYKNKPCTNCNDYRKALHLDEPAPAHEPAGGV